MTEEEEPRIWKYGGLDKIHRIYPSPANVLGREIWWTIKYDGSCLCIWTLDGEIVISSRKQMHAVSDIRNSLLRTKEWPKIQRLLADNPPTLYLFGELQIKGKSPTKIEYHKIDRFVGFDMKLDVTTDEAELMGIQSYQKFLPLPLTYATYSGYKIPVAKVWLQSTHADLDSLYEKNQEVLELARRRRREGAVAKTIDGMYRWKIKPEYKHRNVRKKDRDLGPQLPSLPESEAFGAVDKAFQSLGLEQFQDKRKAMPLVAQFIQEEMAKHNNSMPPRNFYAYYMSYLEDKMEAQTDA